MVLHHLQCMYGSQRNDHQLKHCWADLITMEQDLMDHLGIVIGAPVVHRFGALFFLQCLTGGPALYTVREMASFEDPDNSPANMTPIQVHEFQRRTMRYQHILLVESGFRRMAQRYRNKQASGAWRAFPQGGPTLPTTATTSTTTISTQVAPPTAGTVVPTNYAVAPGPSSGTPSGQPTGIDSTRPHTSSAGTQTAPTATVDPTAFQELECKMDRALRKISHLSRDVRHMNRHVQSIKRTLQRANL
ncbi:hypothetical protein NDU88_003117 [Pleurodeles waltl]|uniref:Uncharacterized protein n=1 Tax=Pleurodeles waltl TaxID=8319 RepID=A0AAV7MQV1_PLEWA|nr:hypothetical protein NDU88_003117 [Pleurodeles waltl]